MSVESKLVFSVIALVLLGLASWSLRPTQTRTVSPRWFIAGAQDPFFYFFFNASGLPRRFAWCFPLVWALACIALLWLLPFASAA